MESVQEKSVQERVYNNKTRIFQRQILSLSLSFLLFHEREHEMPMPCRRRRRCTAAVVRVECAGAVRLLYNGAVHRRCCCCCTVHGEKATKHSGEKTKSRRECVSVFDAKNERELCRSFSVEENSNTDRTRLSVVRRSRARACQILLLCRRFCSSFPTFFSHLLFFSFPFLQFQCKL